MEVAFVTVAAESPLPVTAAAPGWAAASPAMPTAGVVAAARGAAEPVAASSDAGTMRRIDRLQQAELLRRHVDPADHRRVHVSLTDTGHRAMAAMLDHLFDRGAWDAAPAVAPKSFAPGKLRG